MPTFPISLTLPTPGEAQWSGDVNTALQDLKDAVNADVTVDRIDVQASLDMQGQDLTNVKAIRVVTNTDDGSSRQLFTKSDGEWYVRDGSGRLIRLTNSGTLNIAGVSGGIGGAYNGNATFNSSDGKFIWSTLTPGEYSIMENGTIYLHLGSASPYTALRTSPVLGSTYTVTLPSAVGTSKSVLTFDATGSMASTENPSVVSVTASNGSVTNLSAPWLQVTGTLTVVGTTVASGTIARTMYTCSLGPAQWTPVIDGNAFAGGNVPEMSYYNAWTFGSGTAGGLVAELPIEYGTRIVGVKVWCQRASAAFAGSGHVSTLSLIKTSGVPGQGGPTTIDTISTATTGSGTVTMVLPLTGSVPTAAPNFYVLKYIPGHPSAEFYGATIMLDRPIGS